MSPDDSARRDFDIFNISIFLLDVILLVLATGTFELPFACETLSISWGGLIIDLSSSLARLPCCLFA